MTYMHNTESISVALGANRGAGLTYAQISMLQRLEAYDVTPVRQRLMQDRVVPPPLIDLSILEFRRYLSLNMLTGEQHTMFSELVDEVWHTCLLFTQLYSHLCITVCGKFMHHDPWEHAKGETDLLQLWTRFQQAYEPLYGPPGAIWRYWMLAYRF